MCLPYPHFHRWFTMLARSVLLLFSGYIDINWEVVDKMHLLDRSWGTCFKFWECDVGISFTMLFASIVDMFSDLMPSSPLQASTTCSPSSPPAAPTSTDLAGKQKEIDTLVFKFFNFFPFWCLSPCLEACFGSVRFVQLLAHNSRLGCCLHSWSSQDSSLRSQLLP